jgi:outer membrane cobalamin receptor
MSVGSLLLSAALLMTVQGAGPASIAGIVRDTTGQAVAGATVVVSRQGAEQEAVTGGDGRFDVPLPAASGPMTVVVRADGFAEARQSLASPPESAIEIVLRPAGLSEIVTVTALRTEQRLRDIPASVNVVTREDIRRSAAVVADDLLRQVPTFSLFRRTSSLAAHPTAQGVSLRGIGPSGVSRTLVLLDGVPFNDPFGGWVYWTRVPLAGTDRIEVVDSSSSSLYGNYAMGGVINILTAPATPRTLDLRAQYGNRNTPKVDVRASDVWGNVGVMVDGALFDTDGYPIVVATNPAGNPERGLVDKNASVSFQTFNVKMDYTPSPRRAGVRPRRVLPRGARERQGDDDRAARRGERYALVLGERRRPRADRPAGRRAGERVHRRRAVPQQLHGGAGGDPAAERRPHDARADRAEPVGWRHAPVVPRARRAALRDGRRRRALGRRRQRGERARRGDRHGGGPAADLRGHAAQRRALRAGRHRRAAAAHVTASARVDNWRNYNAHNLETDVADRVSPRPGTSESARSPRHRRSPRVAAHYQLTPRVSVWGSLGSGFRAPTLNELYRQFRVGTVLTLANHQLGPERLVGGEAGLTLMPLPNLMVRTTWFDNRIQDPVSNITIAVAGPNVTQQRQNLGRTHVRGIQTDGELRVGASLRLTGGYMYERAQVTEFPANPALVGNFLPQVPRHRGAFQAVYVNPRYVDLALAVHVVGRQFDDDLNARACRASPSRACRATA